MSLPLVLGKSLRDQSVFVTGGWERGGAQRSFRGNRVGGGGGESVLAILSIKGDYRKLTANTEPYGRIR